MSEHIQHPEKILVLAGPTASGKSTIADHLLKNLEKLEFFDAYTTRPRRGEGDNDYKAHLSIEEFLELQRQGFFVEVTKYNGNFYGTAKPSGEKTLMLLDANGLESIYEIYKNTNTQIFTVLLNISPDIALHRACIRTLKQGETLTPDVVSKIQERVALDMYDIKRMISDGYADVQIDLNSESLTLELDRDYDAGKKLVIQTFNAGALNQITDFLNR